MSVSLDGKSRYVRQMFDRIAGHYDSMNRLMTGGMDLAWRWQVIEHLADYAPRQVADLACGTGDMILMLSRYLPSVREIVGVDLSEGMLAVFLNHYGEFQASGGRHGTGKTRRLNHQG